MIRVLETKITMEMTLPEAFSLYHELGKLEKGLLEKSPTLKEVFGLLECKLEHEAEGDLEGG